MRGRSGATAPSPCFFVEKRARMCYNERMKTYDTIGIIGAMDVEVERIAREMTDASSESFARSAFTVGKIDGQKVVVVQSGIGKVNAALVASALVMRYGADAVLMTGIAGTVTRDLHTLDAFVPTDFLQYDVSMPGCEDGFIDVLGEVYLSASPELADALASASRAKRGVMATGEASWRERTPCATFCAVSRAPWAWIWSPPPWRRCAADWACRSPASRSSRTAATTGNTPISNRPPPTRQ